MWFGAWSRGRNIAQHARVCRRSVGAAAVPSRRVLGSISSVNVSDSENSSPVSNPTRPFPTTGPGPDKGLLILPNILLLLLLLLTYCSAFITFNKRRRPLVGSVRAENPVKRGLQNAKIWQNAYGVFKIRR